MGVVKICYYHSGLFCGLNRTVYMIHTANRQYTVSVVTTIGATENVIGACCAVALSRGASPCGNHTHPPFFRLETVSQLEDGITPSACLSPLLRLYCISHGNGQHRHSQRLPHTPAVPTLLSGAAPRHRVVLSSTSHIPTRSHNSVNITPPPPHTSVEHTDTSAPNPQARAGPISWHPNFGFP